MSFGKKGPTLMPGEQDKLSVSSRTVFDCGCGISYLAVRNCSDQIPSKHFGENANYLKLISVAINYRLILA